MLLLGCDCCCEHGGDEQLVGIVTCLVGSDGSVEGCWVWGRLEFGCTLMGDCGFGGGGSGFLEGGGCDIPRWSVRVVV